MACEKEAWLASICPQILLTASRHMKASHSRHVGPEARCVAAGEGDGGGVGSTGQGSAQAEVLHTHSCSVMTPGGQLLKETIT